MARFVSAFVACVGFGLALFPQESFAQAQARFSFDGIANCDQPVMRNFPIHGEGTGTLSRDRSATLDMDSNVEGRMRFGGTLGGRPTETPGGSASLRVLNRNSLRVVRDYPNNVIVIDLTMVGNSCKLRIENRLKPGKRQYTFSTPMGMAYCSRPTITRTSCGSI